MVDIVGGHGGEGDGVFVCGYIDLVCFRLLEP